jgi:DNA-directed RNA polymerase subunit omega
MPPQPITHVVEMIRGIGVAFGSDHFYNDRLAGNIGRKITADMRNDYLQSALRVIDDPTILVNVVSRRVKQLKRGNRPLVESLEKLSPEDTALREIAEGRITYELATVEELARSSHAPVRNAVHSGAQKAYSNG